FQAKVLQRLYPTTVKIEKAFGTPVHSPQGAKLFKDVQLKPSKVTEVPAVSSRKVYTVLPPPEDYVPASGDGWGSSTIAQPVNNAEEMPADLSGSGDCNTTEDDHASKKRKRRRKRKPATFSEGNPPTTAAAADDDDDDDYKGQDAEERNKGNTEGSECLSKNKRRKMKKKRHKEKLLALGIMPRSMALEFTYKQGEEEEEEEGDEKKLEEVLDFLQSTRDLYMSDRSCSSSDPSIFLSATDSLFSHLSDGTSPRPVLSILRRLRALLRQREVEKLHTMLQEFTHTSALPKGTADAFQTPPTSPSSYLSPVSPGNTQLLPSSTHTDPTASPEATPSPTTTGPDDCLSSDGVGYERRNAPVSLQKPSDGSIIPCKPTPNSTPTSPVQVETQSAVEGGVEQGLLHECVVSLGLCVTDEKTRTLSDLLRCFLTEREQMKDELRSLKEKMQ
ncbi:glutamate-rich protein 1-like, partial [Clarias magur]